MAIIPFLNNAYFAAKVGIGTESPGAKLDVLGNNYYTDTGFNLGVNTARQYTFTAKGFTGGKYSLEIGNNNSGNTYDVSFINDGNVGIGTTAPAAKLQVIESGSNNTAIFENSGQTYSYTAIKVAEALNNKAALSFAVGNALASTDIFSEISGSVTNNGGALTGDLVFKTNPGDNLTERMRILANGNVGIGTASPDTLLHIGGIDGEAFRWSNSSTVYGKLSVGSAGARIDVTGANSGFGMGFSMDDSTKMTILPSGNVGIGTTSPGAKFTTSGVIMAINLSLIHI